VATAINDAGQITGYSTTAQGQAHAFRWTPTGPDSGVMLDLGAPAGHSSVGEAINAAGQVAGTTRLGNEPSRAFLWTEGVGRIDLGVLETGAQFPFAAALLINSAGQAAGLSTVRGDPRLAQSFFWTPDTGIQALGGLSGTASFPTDLNDAGQIVGNAAGSFASTRAFLWSPAGGLVDLGTLGGRNSGALAINDLGQVVGEAQAVPGGGLHAFFWSAGVMVDMGTLGGDASSALDINDAGVAVGTAQLSDASFHAFAWSPSDGMVDLNTRVAGAPAGLVLQGAVAVAAQGSVLVRSNLGLILLKPVGGAGFVTGNVSLEGARFSAVVRYEKDANRPSGKVTFSLASANIEFESTGFDWLDVAAGRAQLQGTGTINGSGSYFFQATLVDGGSGHAADSVALRIWHVDSATGGQVVDYDNGAGAVAGNGNLVVHLPQRGG
jgi:probable HAF family extracellular repeat protein